MMHGAFFALAGRGWPLTWRPNAAFYRLRAAAGNWKRREGERLTSSHAATSEKVRHPTGCAGAAFGILPGPAMSATDRGSVFREGSGPGRPGKRVREATAAGHASKWTDDSYAFAFELREKAGVGVPGVRAKRVAGRGSGVGVAPGVDSGQAGKRAVRFSYASSEERIREAARRLCEYLGDRR